MRLAEDSPAADPVRMTLAALANPNKSAVVVVGPPGSGKSFFLTTLLNALSKSSGLSRNAVPPPEFIRPTRGTPDIALSALLQTESEAQRRRAFGVPETAPRPPGGPRPAHLVVIDDLDLMDRSSLCLLSQALDRQIVRLVSTTRTARAAKVIRFLRPARPLAVIDLEPWRRQELTQFVQTHLGGVLHQLTLQRLLSFTGGNPLCLTELIETGATSGRLRRHYEAWVWNGSLHVPPLTDARIGGELESLGGGARDVLATVALAGSVELQVLETVHGTAEVETADDAGLLRVELSDRHLPVSLRSAIDRRVILQDMCVTRRRRLSRQLASVLQEGTSKLAERALQVARLAVHSATPIPLSLHLPAARAALRQHDYSFAERVLAQRQNDSETSDLAASALAAQGRFGPAAHALARIIDEGVVAHRADELAARRAVLLLFGTGDRSSWDRWAAEHPAATGAADSYRAAVHAWSGTQLDRAIDLAMPAVTGGDWHCPATQRALVATMAAQVQLGHLEAAVRTVRPVVDAAGQQFDGIHHANLLAVHGLCQLAKGALDETDRCAAALCDLGLSSDWPYAYQFGALLAGRSALTSARPGHAAIWLGEAAVPTSGPAAAMIRRYTLTQLALAHSLAGRHTDAKGVLLEAERETGSRPPPAIHEMTELTRAEILLAAGLQRAAFDDAIRVADRCHAGNQLLIALLALHVCARIYPSGRITDRMSRLTRRMDFELAQLYTEHAQAAESGDAQRVADVAAAYRTFGCRWLAAETAAAALTLAKNRRGAAWAIRSSRIIDELEEQPDVTAPSWWRAGIDRAAPLTRREREVAELAAFGRTTRQIATQLSLSQRTVENHLQHSYRKLSISRREDLATVLGSGAV
jgi:DNA-binding CsgD family transcriptional regulator/energy-coupling factor transporter ATP-binding protein EcfA2